MFVFYGTELDMVWWSQRSKFRSVLARADYGAAKAQNGRVYVPHLTILFWILNPDTKRSAGPGMAKFGAVLENGMALNG